MDDDKLVVNNQGAPEDQGGEQNTPELSVVDASGGVNARKTGKNEVTLDINIPQPGTDGGDIMRKINRAAREPSAAASAAAPAQEPVDIFDDVAKNEQVQPQALPEDLPKEGRDYGLKKEPTRIYNDDQDFAAEDLQKNKTKNPYLNEKESGDGLALKDADIGQFDSNDGARGIAAANTNGETSPPTLSADDQTNQAEPDMAQQNQLTQSGTQSGIDPNTKVPEVPEFKNDLRNSSNWIAIKTYIPEVEMYLGRIDSMIDKKNFKGAGKEANKLKWRSKIAERTAAIYSWKATMGATVIETIGIVPVLIIIVCLMIPTMVSRKARVVSKFTKNVSNFSTRLKKHRATRSSVLAQQNNLAAAVDQAGSLQPPPRPA